MKNKTLTYKDYVLQNKKQLKKDGFKINKNGIIKRISFLELKKTKLSEIWDNYQTINFQNTSNGFKGKKM